MAAAAISRNQNVHYEAVSPLNVGGSVDAPAQEIPRHGHGRVGFTHPNI